MKNICIPAVVSTSDIKGWVEDTNHAKYVAAKADLPLVSNRLCSFPCVKHTAPPRCSEGRQITRVPNIPGTFSVLSACLSVVVSHAITPNILFMGFEHCAWLVKQCFIELCLHSA